MMSASGVTHARQNAIRFLPSVSCRRATLANFSTSGPSIAATGVTAMLPLCVFYVGIRVIRDPKCVQPRIEVHKARPCQMLWRIRAR